MGAGPVTAGPVGEGKKVESGRAGGGESTGAEKSWAQKVNGAYMFFSFLLPPPFSPCFLPHSHETPTPIPYTTLLLPLPNLSHTQTTLPISAFPPPNTT